MGKKSKKSKRKKQSQSDVLFQLIVDKIQDIKRLEIEFYGRQRGPYDTPPRR